MTKPDPGASTTPTLALAELDAKALRAWGDLGLDQLGRAREEIDALNVFPVPDGDTGTNLFLTFEAGVAAVARSAAGQDLPALTATFAKGALMGARGNSGVIVAQLLRGLAQSFAAAEDAIRGEQLAAAFETAADLAYAAVARPVEGTVLTVARAAAAAASRAVKSPPRAVDQNSLTAAVTHAAQAARVALAHTPNQLEALKRAGVVDAGGRGLVVLLDALERVVVGQVADWSGVDSSTRAWTRPDIAVGASHPPVHGADPNGPEFEVMYLLEADDTAVPGLRTRLDEFGDSVVVVGGEGLWNVHVHADEPGAAVEAGVGVGRPFRIQITSLRPDEPAESIGMPEGDVAAPAVARGVVAVVPGVALADLFESVGAATLIGVPGSRPPPLALTEAITSCRAMEVVVLPNDPDHLAVAELAAQQARRIGIRVAVVPTRAPVQGLAALAVHDSQRRFDDDVVAMTAAAGSTRHGALTLAVREAITSAGICHAGDVLGLIDDDVAVIGSDLGQVAALVVDRMLSAGGELVTVVRGASEIESVSLSTTDQLVEHLRSSRPDVEVVCYDGGQPHYPVLLGVE